MLGPYIECSIDPNTRGRSVFRVLAQTPDAVQREVEDIMDGYPYATFTFPQRITAPDDKLVGWWCALGEAQA